MLHASGLDLGGPLVSASPQNPKGFYEHRAIRQKVLKPLLRELGCDPKGQRTLPPRGVMVLPKRVRKLRKAFLNRLGGGRGYKDAKMLLLWPIFARAFPDAIWVLVRRDPQAIVRSCIRTPFMKGRKFKQGWIDWVQEHEFRMDDLKSSGAQVLELWPDPTEPTSFKETIEGVGLEYDEETVLEALEPSAWHG